MGLLGQIIHPEVEEAVEKVLAAARNAKVPAGILALTPDNINRRLRQGFQFLIAGTDTGFLATRAKNIPGTDQEVRANCISSHSSSHDPKLRLVPAFSIPRHVLA